MMKSITCTLGEGKKQKSHIDKINKTQIVALVIQDMIRMQRLNHVVLAGMGWQLIGTQLREFGKNEYYEILWWIFFHFSKIETLILLLMREIFDRLQHLQMGGGLCSFIIYFIKNILSKMLFNRKGVHNST